MRINYYLLVAGATAMHGVALGASDSTVATILHVMGAFFDVGWLVTVSEAFWDIHEALTKKK